MAQSTGAYIRSRCLRPVLPQCRAFHATSKGIDHPRSSAHRLGRFQASPALKPFFLFLSHHRAVLTTCSNSTTTSDAAANTTTPPLRGRSVAPTPTASALRPCACVCNTIPTFKTLPRPLRARRPAESVFRSPPGGMMIGEIPLLTCSGQPGGRAGKGCMHLAQVAGGQRREKSTSFRCRAGPEQRVRSLQATNGVSWYPLLKYNLHLA